ncbi:MAG: hypothetical protein ABI797_02760 [Chloroflexota bacterium]
MHDAPPTTQLPALRPPDQAALPAATQPELSELFKFMTEAELRFETLRGRIVDRRVTTHGDEVETYEIWLRHPGHAKVITTRADVLARDFEVWTSDGTSVHTYDAKGNTATDRRMPVRPVGVTDPELPAFARIYAPVTVLPAESLADTFIHPHGFCKNVLMTGVIYKRGTALMANGREAILLRCDHPRTSHVLTDRPDHWLEVGVDVQTGMIVLLAEHVAETMTRHAEAVNVSLDERIPDEAFMLHVSADTRRIY